MTLRSKNDNPEQTNVILRAFEGSTINWTSQTINGTEQNVSELAISEITSNIITNDIVMVYVKHNSKNNWSALPLPFIDGDNSFFFSYAILAGKIILRASRQNAISPSKDITFRLLILQGYTEKVASINLLDYNATLEFLGIDQDQTQEATYRNTI